MKIFAILAIIAALIGAYFYYDAHRTPVQYEGIGGRTERCIKHTQELGDDYADSYLDRVKNVFRRCPQ